MHKLAKNKAVKVFGQEALDTLYALLTEAYKNAPEHICSNDYLFHPVTGNLKKGSRGNYRKPEATDQVTAFTVGTTTYKTYYTKAHIRILAEMVGLKLRPSDLIEEI